MPQKHGPEEVARADAHLNRPRRLVQIAVRRPLLTDREPLRNPGRVPDEDRSAVGGIVKLPNKLPGSTNGIQYVRVLVDTLRGHQVWSDDRPGVEHVAVPLYPLDEISWEHQIVVAHHEMLDVRPLRAQMPDTDVQAGEVTDVRRVEYQLNARELSHHVLQGPEVVIPRLVVHDRDAHVVPSSGVERRNGSSRVRGVVVVRKYEPDPHRGRSR